MTTIVTLIIIGYIIIAFYLFPPKSRPLDVFKLNPNLLPYWTKYAAITWIIFVIIHAYFIKRIEWTENNFLLVGVNIGLVILCFSKDRNEDEYSMQIRWRAMYISTISLFVFIGIAGAIRVILPQHNFEHGFYFLFMWLNAALFANIVYFYTSKFFYSNKK